MTPEQLKAAGLRVKPVYWHYFPAVDKNSPEEWFAHPPGIQQPLTVMLDETGEPGLQWVARPFPQQSNYPTAEAAKLELEARYQARILAALEPIHD